MQIKEMKYFVGRLSHRSRPEDMREAIRGTLKPSGIHPVFADDIHEPGNPCDNMARAIKESTFCIFDVTPECRPDVLIGLGIAIACRSAHYLLCEENGTPPYGLQGFEIIKYRNMDHLRRKLEDIILPRWTLPAKDMSEEWVENNYVRHVGLHQAETMRHREGDPSEDLAARNRKAWRFGPSFKEEHQERRAFQPDQALFIDHAVFGPYESLPRPGLYKAYFRLKISDNQGIENVLFLDVVSEGNPRPANMKGFAYLRPRDFKTPDQFQLFSVPFGYGSETDLEYRVCQMLQGWTFIADYIAIVDTAAENEAQKKG